jgi:phosphate transport system permease protein
VLFFIFSLCIIIISILIHLGILLFESLPADIILIPGLLLGALSGFCSYGLLHYKDWARSIIVSISLIVILVFFISAIFEFSTIVFAGKEISQVPVILKTFFICFFYKLILKSSGAIIMLFLFRFLEEGFTESQAQRNLIDRMVRYILLFAASSSILIVLFIFIFTFLESTDAITEIGLDNMLLGTIWRPGSIIGNDTAQFGLVPMVIGSIYSTIGAVIFGVPLSLGTAILLAEIAPPFVREIFRPAVELLAGIPSVIFGLFGLIIIAPLIRKFKITGNTGFGILNASIVLAIMILPTVTNIAEDAIRAVPDSYRRASLAIGATKWQTIKNVILPSARSGIIAAVILGIGRALGETMALIMVIGNSIAIPKPLNENPLTLFFATARTLTGNIAVEINYAAGVHRSALFFTGVLLFILLLVINRIANYLMRVKKPV